MDSSRSNARAVRRNWRSLFLRIHRWIGYLTAVLIFVVVLTGLLLLNYRALDLMNHARVTPGQIGDFSKAIQAVLAQKPGAALSWIEFAADEDRSWQLFYREAGSTEELMADFDPYTGEVLRYGSYEESWFHILLELHYKFLVGVPGMLLALLVALALLTLSISGFWIYRRQIRQLFRWPWRRGRKVHANALSLHSWSGLWSLALSLIWAFTGLLLLAFMLPHVFDEPWQPKASDPKVVAQLPDLALMHRDAQSQFPSNQLRGVRLVLHGEKPRFVYRVLCQEKAPWHKFAQLHYDAGTGELLEKSLPEDNSLERKFFMALKALHFGFFGHELTHWLYSLSAGLLLLLPCTGLFMRWKRRRRRAA